MFRSLIAFVVVGYALVVEAQADIPLDAKSTLAFASIDEGKQILSRRDDFVERLSGFDRSARLKTEQDVSESRYLEFVGSQVLAWDDDEKKRIEAAIDSIRQPITSLSLPWPTRIELIKTTGLEEGQAAYTRHTAIILPVRLLKGSDASLKRLMCHELFHVLSRNAPALRDRLYQSIGFEKCDEVALPPSLQASRLTNPDAPRYDHCIQVNVDGKDVWAVPVLYTLAKSYDSKRGGEFFDYLTFKLLLVDHAIGSTQSTPLEVDGMARVVDPDKAIGFMEKIGRNTGYIIHPDEILADNFTLIVVGATREIRSPDVLEKIRNAMDSKN